MTNNKAIDQESKVGQDGSKKQCSRCKRFKDKRAFNNDSTTPDGKARQCRVCRIRTQKASKKKYLRKVDALKANVSCAKCGEKRTYVIDFHHNDPKKKIASISDMRDQQRPIAEIKKEILKTTPLCACCHRELHYLKLDIKQYLKGDY